jgi:peptidoglycan/LPS O-acetylase OafA/YrhL
MWKSLVFAVAVGSLALAQDSIPTDISQWFTNTAALAAVVAALVALLRKHVLKNLDGLPVVAVSIVLGGVLGYVGKLLGYLGGDWLLFGLSAGFIASGGVDLLKSLRGGKDAATGDTEPAGDTDIDASRSRLR